MGVFSIRLHNLCKIVILYGEFVSFLLILFIAIANFAVASSLKGRVSVIDGDTLEMHGKRIRLHGIGLGNSMNFLHFITIHLDVHQSG